MEVNALKGIREFPYRRGRFVGAGFFVMDRGLVTVGHGKVVKDRHRQSSRIVTEGERYSPYVFALWPGSLVLLKLDYFHPR